MSLQITLLECGAKFVSPASGVPLVVFSRSGIVDGRAETVVATEDGRRADTSTWHAGPEADGVWVERWNFFTREFHGVVDSASRQLVQAG